MARGRARQVIPVSEPYPVLPPVATPGPDFGAMLLAFLQGSEVARKGQQDAEELDVKKAHYKALEDERRAAGEDRRAGLEDKRRDLAAKLAELLEKQEQAAITGEATRYMAEPQEIGRTPETTQAIPYHPDREERAGRTGPPVRSDMAAQLAATRGEGTPGTDFSPSGAVGPQGTAATATVTPSQAVMGQLNPLAAFTKAARGRPIKPETLKSFGESMKDLGLIGAKEKKPGRHVVSGALVDDEGNVIYQGDKGKKPIAVGRGTTLVDPETFEPLYTAEDPEAKAPLPLNETSLIGVAQGTIPPTAVKGLPPTTTPEQAQRMIDTEMANRVKVAQSNSENAAKVAARTPQESQELFANIVNAQTMIQEMQRLAPDVQLDTLVGGIRPWINKVMQTGKIDLPLGASVPVPSGSLTPEQDRFLALTQNYVDTVLRLRSGKQINEAEAARMLEFLAQPGLKANVFMTRLQLESDLLNVRRQVWEQVLSSSRYLVPQVTPPSLAPPGKAPQSGSAPVGTGGGWHK